MGGDVGLQKNITGMNPDPAIHSSEFIIQPVCPSHAFLKTGNNGHDSKKHSLTV